MRTTRGLCGVLLGVAVVATGAATCERNDTFSFTNDTTQTVVVQLMGGNGQPIPVATLTPGQQAATHLGGDENACDTAQYRAVDAGGAVVDHVTHECGGQTWSIRTR